MCPTVARIRKCFAKHGLETAVHLNHPLDVRIQCERMESRAATLPQPQFVFPTNRPLGTKPKNLPNHTSLILHLQSS